jgi:hypothetical protein
MVAKHVILAMLEAEMGGSQSEATGQKWEILSEK